tara:strand:+ start:8563 stop:8838 length:276 start_codon:yes stop_codon:yes gene_type:complete
MHHSRIVILHLDGILARVSRKSIAAEPLFDQTNVIFVSKAATSTASTFCNLSNNASKSEDCAHKVPELASKIAITVATDLSFENIPFIRVL